MMSIETRKKTMNFSHLLYQINKPVQHYHLRILFWFAALWTVICLFVKKEVFPGMHFWSFIVALLSWTAFLLLTLNYLWWLYHPAPERKQD